MNPDNQLTFREQQMIRLHPEINCYCCDCDKIQCIIGRPFTRCMELTCLCCYYNNLHGELCDGLHIMQCFKTVSTEHYDTLPYTGPNYNVTGDDLSELMDYKMKGELSNDYQRKYKYKQHDRQMTIEKKHKHQNRDPDEIPIKPKNKNKISNYHEI